MTEEMPWDLVQALQKLEIPQENVDGWERKKHGCYYIRLLPYPGAVNIDITVVPIKKEPH